MKNSTLRKVIYTLVEFTFFCTGQTFSDFSLSRLQAVVDIVISPKAQASAYQDRLWAWLRGKGPGNPPNYDLTFWWLAHRGLLREDAYCYRGISASKFFFNSIMNHVTCRLIASYAPGFPAPPGRVRPPCCRRHPLPHSAYLSGSAAPRSPGGSRTRSSPSWAGSCPRADRAPPRTGGPRSPRSHRA